MASIREGTYPRLAAEYEAMKEQGAAILRPDQQEVWNTLVDDVRGRFLSLQP